MVQCCALITSRGETRGHRCKHTADYDDVRCKKHMVRYLTASRTFIWTEELAAYAAAAKLKERGLLKEWKAFAEERAKDALNTEGKTYEELRATSFPFGPMPEKFQMMNE